jgi:hypothetical protein
MSTVTLQLDTRAARRSLYEQIGRLERELAQTLATTYPPIAQPAGQSHHGPRLLGLEELELTRDALAHAVFDVRQRAREQATRQQHARARLADMWAHPDRHKGERITALELGLPGCTAYAVKPRLCSRWWRVKVSSGCP